MLCRHDNGYELVCCLTLDLSRHLDIRRCLRCNQVQEISIGLDQDWRLPKPKDDATPLEYFYRLRALARLLQGGGDDPWDSTWQQPSFRESNV